MKQLLQKAGLKVTAKRLAILDVLAAADKPLTAEEVYKLLEDNGDNTMSFSTIYRGLNAMLDAKILLMQVNQDSKQYFQLNSNTHRHTIRCTSCGLTIPVAFCPMGEFESKLEKTTGFEITGHSFEFTGVCPVCRMSQL